jgi:predicted GIY-YIG superfamily endonuclease
VQIKIEWAKPIQLQEHAPIKGFPLWIDDWESLPECAGVYVFARKYGMKIDPIYIGKADNLRIRIKQHLKGNVALVTAMRDGKKGYWIVMYAKHIRCTGQTAATAVKIAERALIYEAINAGFDLHNKQGKKILYSTIISEGPLKFRMPKIDKTIYLKTEKIPKK